MNSPNRVNNMNVKRKMPETFYRPPVLKTQLFSAGFVENGGLHQTQPQIHPRIIQHSHTNSLPVVVDNLSQQQQQPLMTTAVSTTSLINTQQQSPMKTIIPTSSPHLFQTQPQPQPIIIQNIHHPNHHHHQQQPLQQHSDVFMTSNSMQQQHAKTYSLPVSFDVVANSSGLTMQQQMAPPPPIRTFNSHGDIPLPPGWDFQQTSNGQLYYIK